MDSISQIVLGASMGEVVLGRKLGNKAMFWGALGGTIPDLDIITSPFLSEIDSLVFHRGISHSIFFAILGGLGFGWLAYKLHKSIYYRNILWAILSLFISCIPISIVFFLFGQDDLRYYFAGASIIIALAIYSFIHKKKSHQPIQKIDNPFLFQWQLMFFLAFLTHSLLDCLTLYGTQLFLPFSDYRVAFSTVAVADPLGYTIPFLICLAVAMFFKRTESKRQLWTWGGIAISTFYLMFTAWNKANVFEEFDKQLAEQHITYDRYSLSPYIFSNFLWSMTVENEDKYYVGSYSIFDKSPIYFLPVEKNRDLINDGAESRTIKTLQWFTNGFYNVMERPDGKIQFNDLRYGTFRQKGDIKDFVFRFHLVKEAIGEYRMDSTLGGPDEESTTGLFRDLYIRIKGR